MPTHDTPQERDDKAEVLTQERDDKADVLKEERIDKAEVLARRMRQFQWEVRVYIVILLTLLVIRQF